MPHIICIIYVMVAKIARNGCDRDRLRVSITSPMPKCPILKGKNYFGIGDVIDTRDLSLSQPFLAILATIAYLQNTSRITSRASFSDELIRLMIQSSVFPQKHVLEIQAHFSNRFRGHQTSFFGLWSQFIMLYQMIKSKFEI